MRQIVLAALAATLATGGCRQSSETFHPAYKDLTEAVYASGNIYPENEYKVFANADGFLLESKVEEGDTVQKDQLLFRLDNQMQNARAQSASAIYRQAQDNLREGSPALQEARTAVASAREKLHLDSTNYMRYGRLVKQNAASQIDYDRAKLAYEVSKNELAARKNSLSRLRNQLYVDLQNAESQYKVTRADEKYYAVRSFINGRVYEVYKEQGEAVRRNEPIALLGDARQLYLRLVVDELDIAKVREGQEVLIRTDVQPDQVYRARVSKIYPKLNKETQSFRVDADFTAEKPAPLYGLTVEANIVVGNYKNVLTIPKKAMVGTDSVFVREGTEEKKIKVERGVESADLVQIKSGLTPESEVVLK